ncbi:hypothetical protein BS50DRAFT_57535 [Corynespora cassiicola Philippines]|uniref:Uncharacterized protein n=1 Tax=Corynespora cassiicola Philippines TaxID=1448308 RepID=A0A2T2NIZ4_CORCC|nr:hypothetical protein BS50DRAFT_57535 [Corynespora cassiicola Philippines]
MCWLCLSALGNHTKCRYMISPWGHCGLGVLVCYTLSNVRKARVYASTACEMMMVVVVMAGQALTVEMTMLDARCGTRTAGGWSSR